MVLIPKGMFVMGASTDDGYEECMKHNLECFRWFFTNESPKHEVILNSYYIDKFEVTQAQFQKVMGRNPSRYKGDNLPVENTFWNEANGYCRKLGKRLPTEAEWERAARGGTTTRYYWGEDFKTGYENFCDKNCLDDLRLTQYDDGHDTLAPVGSFKPNPYGLYDMLGNVYEWVSDWYDEFYYHEKDITNPQGPKRIEPEGVEIKRFTESYEWKPKTVDMGAKVIRGSSWDKGTWGSMRVSARLWDASIDKRGAYKRSVGFRCAMPAK